ncbi:translation initiation factor 2 [Actinoplanes sp. LDG1-06]|uniref:Translation initiation factor 2 n=1 Tax=Paractinoplanes ovalisporus TaxID=2810368 RepID=A0ABS2APH4_9ACTN|nr:translation initiation factor 2 [Actinoplanes ovalisporus]MBM2621109.1 translation initiation factor 2 [Actinoplanes ovalisporus]
MPEQYFVTDASAPASPTTLRDTISPATERILWSGHTAVAEYAFDEPASLPRWTLPEETEVVVTDQRVLYRGPGAADSGELRWPWPQHLRVQPGNRDTGRQATVTQIQLVCAGPGGSFPALVFAGGDLATVSDADRLANTLRQAIARYRVENATELGIAAQQVRMLSRLVIGPEFNNFQGGEGQTVSLIGAVSVEAAPPSYDSRPGYAPVAQPGSAQPVNGSAAIPSVPHQSYASLPPVSPAASQSSRPPVAPVSSDPYASRPSVAPVSSDPHASRPVSSDPYASRPVSSDPYASRPVSSDPYASRPVSSDPAAMRTPVVPAASEPAAGRPPVVPAASDIRPAIDAYAEPAADEARPHIDVRPEVPQREWRARPADDATLNGHPDLDTRAAELAARVANLVAGGAGLGAGPLVEFDNQTNLSAYLDVPPASAPRPREAADEWPSEAGDRAESVRRTAARFAGNAARGRSTTARHDGEVGSSGRGSHRQG